MDSIEIYRSRMRRGRLKWMIDNVAPYKHILPYDYRQSYLLAAVCIPESELARCMVSDGGGSIITSFSFFLRKNFNIVAAACME